MRIEDYIALNSKSTSYVRLYGVDSKLISEKIYDGLCDIDFVSS
jgi:hypothetical protein